MYRSNVACSLKPAGKPDFESENLGAKHTGEGAMIYGT